MTWHKKCCPVQGLPEDKEISNVRARVMSSQNGNVKKVFLLCSCRSNSIKERENKNCHCDFLPV